jgi:hypothetical protein
VSSIVIDRLLNLPRLYKSRYRAFSRIQKALGWASCNFQRIEPRPGSDPPVRQRLSQGGLIRHLGLEDQVERDYISKFERGILEPTLDVLLAYACAISSTGRGEFLVSEASRRSCSQDTHMRIERSPKHFGA